MDTTGVEEIMGRQNRKATDDLRVKVGILRTVLLALRRETHDSCEDGWYACPKSEDYLGNDTSGECNCGLDVTNALIDATLEETK